MAARGAAGDTRRDAVPTGGRHDRRPVGRARLEPRQRPAGHLPHVHHTQEPAHRDRPTVPAAAFDFGGLELRFSVVRRTNEVAQR